MREMILAGARSLASALMTVVAAGAIATGAAALPQGGQQAEPAPPPSEYLECWEITQSWGATAQVFGAMYCRCGGLFGSGEVEIGPVVVGPSAPPGQNGGLLPNCYAVEITTPAHNEAVPGGAQNLHLIHLPVIADHYSCDRGGCYWFHGTARCRWMRSQVTGYRPYYAHAGTCGQGNQGGNHGGGASGS